ncbi:unnamed protein product [Linum tenue]|uniref:Uncharacterized protein n=1 Tax=Linum tenue TaxID=586396 RepID=A0AAV0K846_9ROSI|nr:unnamed protein product [Linum tenue]
MILVGASAAGDYSPSSNAAGEVPKPQSKAPSSASSYDKPEPVAQKMPKAEESGKPALESDPKSESYDEHAFQHSGDLEKPDFHFPDMSHPEVHSESYEKPIVPSVSKPEELGMPELGKDLNPKPEEAFPAAVEGTVICKSPSGYVPIEGAVVRITCLQEDDEGYVTTPVSCQTGPTDAKGYFFKTLPSSNKTLPSNKDDKKNSWENCKAFLEQSPMEECGVPSNVNRGIDGFPLSSHRILQDKHLKLYSVGPFFYTSEHKPTMNKVPAGGY